MVESSTSPIYVLCDDLMFASRITGTARHLEIPAKTARSVTVLEQLLAQQRPSCVIVDLANPGLELGGLVQKLRNQCQPMPRVVAFGSHVDAATLHSAREAGCDPVLPRSRFVDELPRALPAWSQPETATGLAPGD